MDDKKPYVPDPWNLLDPAPSYGPDPFRCRYVHIGSNSLIVISEPTYRLLQGLLGEIRKGPVVSEEFCRSFDHLMAEMKKQDLIGPEPVVVTRESEHFLKGLITETRKQLGNPG